MYFGETNDANKQVVRYATESLRTIDTLQIDETLQSSFNFNEWCTSVQPKTA